MEFKIEPLVANQDEISVRLLVDMSDYLRACLKLKAAEERNSARVDTLKQKFHRNWRRKIISVN